MQKNIKNLWVLFLLLPLLARAYPTENFDYTEGANLTGQSGGSGWTTNWSCNGWITTATGGITGVSAYSSTGAEQNCSRNFTAETGDNKIVSIYAKPENNNQNFYFELKKIGGAEIEIISFFRSTGQFAVYDNVTLTNIQAYSANTIYHLEFEIKVSTEEFRVRIDSGSWSAWYHMYDYVNQTHDAVSQMLFSANLGGGWFDTIGETSVSPPSGATSTLTTFEISQVFLMGMFLFFIGVIMGLNIIWGRQQLFSLQ